MKILIKEIRKGSYDPATKAVYDYYIKGITENNLEIEIFDYEYKNFDKYLNKTLDFLLIPFVSKEPPGFLIEGKFNGKYSVSMFWNDFNRNLELVKFFSILTDYGEFLLEKEDIKKLNLKFGDNVRLYTDRIDIVAWRLI